MQRRRRRRRPPRHDDLDDLGVGRVDRPSVEHHRLVLVGVERGRYHDLLSVDLLDDVPPTIVATLAPHRSRSPGHDASSLLGGRPPPAPWPGRLALNDRIVDSNHAGVLPTRRSSSGQSPGFGSNPRLRRAIALPWYALAVWYSMPRMSAAC